MQLVERDRLSVQRNGAQWSLYDDGHYVRELSLQEVTGLISGSLVLTDLLSADVVDTGQTTSDGVLQFH